MSEEMGIKETKEALVGALKLGKLLYASFKDGVQTNDFAVLMAKIMGDEALKTALLEAYNGADKVASEVKNMSVAEGFEVAQALLAEGLA